jgi:hypothetical protein
MIVSVFASFSISRFFTHRIADPRAYIDTVVEDFPNLGIGRHGELCFRVRLHSSLCLLRSADCFIYRDSDFYFLMPATHTT